MVATRIFAVTILLHIAVTASHSAEIDGLRILTFNVWTGEGTRSGREKIAEIISASEADIVGLQEMGNRQGMEVAESLGFHYLQQSGSDTQILSRYPILERSRGRWGAEIEPTPGHSVWLFNAHLAAYPYQPYDLRDRTLASNEGAVVAAANSARGNQTRGMLRDIDVSGALSSGKPIFIAGDFNEPSHLDWTQAAADFTERSYDFKVDYPTSMRITELGFADSFRSVRPLETATGDFDFAYTWTPGYPPPNVPRNEVHDRIDILYHRSGDGVGVVPVDALTIGPSPDRDADRSMTDIAVPGYNADHRAVVTAYDLTGLYGSTLTFSKLGANGDVMNESYGDRLVTTPSIQVDYAANAGAWQVWEENNWDRGGVVALNSGMGEPAAGAQFELVLSADSHTQVQLDRFDLLDWEADDDIGHSVEWQVRHQDTILAEGIADIPDDGTLTVETNVATPVSGKLTLRLTHLSGNNNELAIDNVHFDQFLLGDFNRNRSLDSADITELGLQVSMRDSDATYDLNADGEVNEQDRIFWVETLANTYFGDSNLDGEFNSSDLVDVFQASEYEDDLVGNSTWAEGDWNGDGEFGTADLVLAFQGRGFERGPRVVAVAEPLGSTYLMFGCSCLLSCPRLRGND